MQVGADLVRRGHAVWGLRRSVAGCDGLATVGIRPLAADVTAPGSLAHLDAGYDWVVNCVSASGGGVADYRRVYLDGARNLLAWLRPRPPRRFVYTSSTGVYGQVDGSEVDEASPTEPSTDTGAVLVETERVLLDAAEREGLPAVVLRVAGIYGPGRGYWLRQFLAGEARIEGDGSRVLNLVHRDDAAGAIAAALERGRTGGVYNVADDEPVTQLDLFRWLAARLGRPLPPAVAADRTSARRRGLTNKRVSNRRLRQELAWAPIYPTFREGFAAELANPATSVAPG
jgi:nucleoside-diphosphate-sugar epimerase